MRSLFHVFNFTRTLHFYDLSIRFSLIRIQPNSPFFTIIFFSLDNIYKCSQKQLFVSIKSRFFMENVHKDKNKKLFRTAFENN